MENIDLAAIRKNAGLSQAQVAESLGLSQSQVSRYEADPSETPYKYVKAWTQLCGDVHRSKGIKIDDNNKRTKLNAALSKVYDWFRFTPSMDELPDFPNLLDILSLTRRLSRKPRVVVAGKYDTGKSTLLNYLIGGKKLPTSYQPTTSVVCHIRHINDKPVWQVEPVRLLSENYNIDAPDDQENAEKHTLFKGGYDVLTNYGQHPGKLDAEILPSVNIQGAAVAVVYLDSSILQYVDFIDVPGYANNESDSRKAGLTNEVYDALIYTSAVNGFLDGQDVIYLRTLIDKLNPVEAQNEVLPLRNLFILGTHIHSISSPNGDNSRSEILTKLFDGAANRAGHELEATLKEASLRWRFTITEDTLRDRMFGFAVEDNVVSITGKFIDDLKEYIGEVAPESCYLNIKKYIKTSKAKNLSVIEANLSYYEQILKDHSNAYGKYNDALSRRGQAENDFETERARLSLQIKKYSENTDIVVNDVYEKYINIEYIEKKIYSNYSDKKDADKYLCSYLTDKVQREINANVSIFSEELNAEISATLRSIDKSINPLGIGAPFDVQSAFLSALTGVGAAGALAGWAAVVAGGSNLGGYILAAKVVGWLSAMGISVGGSATVMSTIAALGGPVTIAIGIGVLIAAGLYGLFGSSWQTRMAKRTVEQLSKQEVKKQLLKNFKKYWQDTELALNHSMAGALKSYDAYLEELRSILDLDVEELRDIISKARDMEGFLRSMPLLPEKL